MKEQIEKVFSLGLGIVTAGKEQIEKTVEELVKKGEVAKSESQGLIEELTKKGEETRSKIEQMVKDRVQAILADMQVVTKQDLERIEQRLDALENKHSAEE